MPTQAIAITAAKPIHWAIQIIWFNKGSGLGAGWGCGCPSIGWSGAKTNVASSMRNGKAIANMIANATLVFSPAIFIRAHLRNFKLVILIYFFVLSY